MRGGGRMTKQEVFNKLLGEFESASMRVIWEYSGSIEADEQELEAEIENWRKEYEEAE
jgi:hypothetical protein